MLYLCLHDNAYFDNLNNLYNIVGINFVIRLK